MKTKVLLTFGKNTKEQLINKLSSLIASIFSIVFSLSIVKEFYKQEDRGILMTLILTIFIILFLVFNEYVKVKSLRSRFSKNKDSLMIIIFTFIISFFLSGIGIYFWTNKSYDKSIENIVLNSSNEENISKRYNHIIDSLSSLTFNNTQEFNRLSEELTFWKKRPAVSLKEREVISNKISDIQSQLTDYRNDFDKHIQSLISIQQNNKELELSKLDSSIGVQNKKESKGNFISIIFVSMVLMTELLIVYFSKEYSSIENKINDMRESGLGSEFKERYNILTDILLRKESIDINDVKYSRFQSKRGDWDNGIKPVFGLYKELGITEGVSLQEAQLKLRNYYDQLLNL